MGDAGVLVGVSTGGCDSAAACTGGAVSSSHGYGIPTWGWDPHHLMEMLCLSSCKDAGTQPHVGMLYPSPGGCWPFWQRPDHPLAEKIDFSFSPLPLPSLAMTEESQRACFSFLLCHPAVFSAVGHYRNCFGWRKEASDEGCLLLHLLFVSRLLSGTVTELMEL